MVQKRIKEPYDAFLEGFEGNEEKDLLKNPKRITVSTQDDKDFLDGWYSHDPEDQRPIITVKQEKQTQPTTFKQEKTSLSQANTTAYKEPKSYSSSLNSMTDNKYSNYLQNAAKGARDAVSSATSLWNEPQKTNNYTPKHTNGEQKITSFLNSKQTAQTKPQRQGVLQSLGTGASYHNSGGMSANWDRNGSLDLSGTRKAVERIGNALEKYTPQISNGLFAANNYGATSPQNMLNSLDVLLTNANRFVDNYGDIFVNAGLGSLTGQNNGIADYTPASNWLFNSVKNNFNDYTNSIAKAYSNHVPSKGIVGSAFDGLAYANSGGMSANWQGADKNSVQQTATDLNYTKDMVSLTPLAIKEGFKDFYGLNADALSKGMSVYNGGTGYYQSRYGDSFLAEAIAAMENSELQKAIDKIAEQYPVLGYGAEPMANFLLNGASQIPTAAIAAINLPLGAGLAGTQAWGSASQGNYDITNSLKDANISGAINGTAAAVLEFLGGLGIQNIDELPKIMPEVNWTKFWDDIGYAIKDKVDNLDFQRILQYTKGKNWTKTEGSVPGKTKYDSIVISEITSQKELNSIIEDIRLNAGSPLEIPSNARAIAQTKANGYQQIKYQWYDDIYKYESRWHTVTPGAVKYNRGTTWVVTRTIPGNAKGQSRKVEYLVGDKWISEEIWEKAQTAHMTNTATQEQKEILEAGHWQAR